MTEIRTPSAVPIRWEVRRKADEVRLGVVKARLWFEARELACHQYSVDRGDIDVVAIDDGLVAFDPKNDELRAAPAHVQPRTTFIVAKFQGALGKPKSRSNGIKRKKKR